MGTFVVDTTLDVVNAGDGVTSLREAVTLANTTAGADEIVFDASLMGSTLILTQGELVLLESVSVDGDINGDDRADITISGDNNSRIFLISSLYSPTTADVSSVNLQNHYAGTVSGFGGGAIAVVGGATLNLSHSTIQAGGTYFSGGAIYNNASTVNIANSTLTANNAGYYGGAIYTNGDGETNIVNTTIYNNAATAFGGGISLNGALTTVTLTNSTVSGNYAGVAGGGIDLFGGMLEANNTVVAQNIIVGPVENDLYAYTGTLTAQNSFFGTAVTIDVDNGYNTTAGGNAGLGLLGDNGGSVHTMAIDYTSPLYNAGATGLLPAGTETAANGVPRVNGVFVDIGAYEAGTVVTTLSDIVNAGDGVLSLREAIALGNAGTLSGPITFDPSLAGGSIFLTNGQLSLTNDMLIDGDLNGDGRADITIFGDGTSRLFEITNEAFVAIESLTLANGFANDGNGGGAIRVDNAELFLFRSSLVLNQSVSGYSSGGGAIEVVNSLNDVYTSLPNAVILSSVAIVGNYSNGYSGGLGIYNSNVAVYNSTIYGNYAANAAGGAGIIAGPGGGSLAFYGSTIVENYSAAAYGGGGVGSIFGDVRFFDTVVANNYSYDGVSTYVANDFALYSSYITAGAGFFSTFLPIDSDLGSNQNNAGDPLLGELLDNGGAVATLAPINTTLLTSPLIDTGDVLGPLFDLADEDGDGNFFEFPPVDGRLGPRNLGADIDIGAVEYFDDETIRGIDVYFGNLGFIFDEILVGGIGNDILEGGPGNDTLDGGAGTDTAEYLNETSGVEIRLNTGTAVGLSAGNDTLISIENVEGSNFDDLIFGNNDVNVINGNGGDDNIFALGANDIVNGGDGNDTLNGNLDGDTLNGDAGDDLVLGAQGNDILNGSDGNDIVSGGSGEDTVSGGAGDDEVLGGGDNDMLFGNEGNDTLSGGGGDDTASGGDGNDLVLGAGGNDTVLGGDGVDTVSGGTGIDIVNGGAGDDMVFGADGNDTEVRGGADNDTVSGGTGNDNVFGDSGDDNVIGASGDDRLDGGTGTDSLTGGIGFDTLVFGLGYGSDSVGGFEDDIDTLELDEDLWIGTHGVLTAAQVVAMFSTQTGGGTIDFTFDGGDTLRVTQGAGILQADLIDDITIV